MIPLVDLTAQYHSIKEEIDTAIHATLESGHFILGPTVAKFEESIAAYLGVNHAIGLASGTDALVLALRALEIGAGDEVIIPAYTFSLCCLWEPCPFLWILTRPAMRLM
jgi:dTDP-4-amino-4,6-dideoxygalactose transaminase